LISEIERN
jgi:hypothetical protein